ncbi:putative pentatricopeptide repeat-containing protein, mitochondrial [Capsicum annuum]|nr:putative pentatricopeptide repeat-containing protein, mitochondrial [Capsicum annuum]
MVGGNTFAKTICSICYEDLKPVVEDLQSISLCGHVFHELCLQQWFEYCTNGKKKNCPVCKQTCTEKNTHRLYFQSVGDPNDPSLSQKPPDSEEGTPCELRNEVKRLEGKVLKLVSTLEQQQEDLKEVNVELFSCKEQLKVEVALKNEAKKQKTATEQLLRVKSQELDQSTLECRRLQERNMALAKELAALKLVCDVNLGEEEVLKLASLGNVANSKETVDVLKKSLVIRNKSYKELMTKCNTLGRGEARTLSKLEKAVEKIDKLKARVHELEMAVEGRDNEALRTLRTSANFEIESRKGFSKEPKVVKCSYENQKREPADTVVHLHQVTGSGHDSGRGEKRKVMCNDGSEEDTTDCMIASCLDQDYREKNSLQENKDGGILETFSRVHQVSNRKLNPLIDHKKSVHESVYSRLKRSSGTADATQAKVSDNKDELSGLKSCGKSRDHCFSGGLLGPDGTNRHLGKWCKKVQNKGSAGLPGSGANSGDLISVGADGRGGRIKVLRSINQAAMVGIYSSLDLQMYMCTMQLLLLLIYDIPAKLLYSIRSLQNPLWILPISYCDQHHHSTL